MATSLAGSPSRTALPNSTAHPHSTDSRSRRHDLDALRAFAMLAGIVLHAALSFAPIPWIVQDTRQNDAFRVLYDTLHGFRMPMFFIVSGFFTAMLWRQRGLPALLKQRGWRIGLPLAIGMVTIIPLTWAAIIIAAVIGSRVHPADADKSLVAAVRLGNIEQVEKHLQAGADPDQFEEQLGITPLGWASLQGNTAVAEVLLDHGGFVDAPNRDGAKPLLAATFMGRVEMVRLLLERGADPFQTNNDGAGALEIANVDQGTTRYLANMIGVPFDWEEISAGREAVKPLIVAAQESPSNRALDPSRGEGTVEQSTGLEPSMATEVRPDSEPQSAGAGFVGKLREQYGRWIHTGLVAGLIYMPVFQHLWFLYFLCWFVAAFAVYALIANAVGWQGLPRVWVVSPLRLLWLLPLTFLPQLLMGIDSPVFGPDTSIGLLPLPHLLFYYGVFYAFGVLYYDSHDEAGLVGGWWWLSLPLGLFVLYPLGMYFKEDFWLFATMQVLYAWALSFGLMGLFRRWLAAESPTLRYLSDASYWMYLAHMPLIFLAQAMVRTWPLPAALKFILVTASVTAILLLSYRYMVRYTLIGRVLNGPRQRPSIEVAGEGRDST